jgi:hypothetical protein
MKKILRKTITIPESLYKQAKIHAAYCNESFSAYVVNILESKIRKRKKMKIDPMKTLGRLSLGIKKLPTRSEIYDEYLKKKLGL